MIRKMAFSLLVAVLFVGCETNNSACSDGVQNGTETGVDCGGDCPPCAVYNIEGHAQKGPFLNGSSVLVTSLDTSLNQVGVTYNTQILDNSGYFFTNGLNLASSFVTLRADGFYFNEVCGAPSNAQITLNAITDLNNVPAVNVNTLTHLEKNRVEYLVASGSSFAAAKSQALKEILSIFNVDTTGTMPMSETLNIANSGTADGILIAITSILQGYRSESEFSDLMANLVTDLRTDGVLNSPILQSALMAHAKVLDTNVIRQNIIDRYASMGITVNVPAFGGHVQNYINNSPHSVTTTVIEYPEDGPNGKSILNTTDSIYNQYQYYGLMTTRPNDCVSLKLVIERQFFGCQYGCWFYSVNSVQSWNISSYDQSTNSQTFISTGLETDLEMGFEPGRYKASIYLNDSPTPQRIKEFRVN